MKQLCYVLLAAAPSVFLAQSASSQWSVDQIVNTPVCTATGSQEIPLTVSDGTGGGDPPGPRRL